MHVVDFSRNHWREASPAHLLDEATARRKHPGGLSTQGALPKLFQCNWESGPSVLSPGKRSTFSRLPRNFGDVFYSSDVTERHSHVCLLYINICIVYITSRNLRWEGFRMSFHEKSALACLISIVLVYVPYFFFVFRFPMAALGLFWVSALGLVALLAVFPHR